MNDKKDEQINYQEVIKQLQEKAEGELKKLTSDRTVRRFMRRIQNTEIGKTLGKGGLEVLTVFLSTPTGQWLTAIIILELLAKMKFFSQISVDILISVITSAEFIKAIGGGQSMVSTIAGLAGLFE